MDNEEFILKSLELDIDGKFKEADNLTNSFLKTSQYIPQNEQIQAAGLRGGAGFGGWLADQARGMNIWFGGGMQRSQYIQGAYEEALAFHNGLSRNWPAEYGNHTKKEYRTDLKIEFKRYLNAAMQELDKYSVVRGFRLDNYKKNDQLYSYLLNHNTEENFIELQSWVEAQMRIFSKEKAFGNYLRYLRYAETTIASLISEPVQSPQTSDKNLINEFRPAAPNKQTENSSTTSKSDERSSRAPTPQRSSPKPKAPSIRWLD